MSAHDTFTWLGLDSSFRAFGWALFVDDGEVHSCQLYKAGLWETERDPKLKPTKTKTGKKKKPPGIMKDNARRIEQLGEQLRQLVETEHPVAIFIEALAVPFNAPPRPGQPRQAATSLVTVQALGRVRGIVDGVALCFGIPVIEYSAQSIKLVMTGRRDAEKEDVAKRALQLYPAARNFLPVGEVDDNVTDAVSVGHMGEQHEIIALHRRRRGAGQADFFAEETECDACHVVHAGPCAASDLIASAEVTRGDVAAADVAAALETPAEKIRRLATPAIVKGRPEHLGDLTGTKFGEQLAAHEAKKTRPPKRMGGKLTAEPPRTEKPKAFEPPAPEQLAEFWKADE